MITAWRIGLCGSATRAPSRPWIADASARPERSTTSGRELLRLPLCKPWPKRKTHPISVSRQAAVPQIASKAPSAAIVAYATFGACPNSHGKPGRATFLAVNGGVATLAGRKHVDSAA